VGGNRRAVDSGDGLAPARISRREGTASPNVRTAVHYPSLTGFDLGDGCLFTVAYDAAGVSLVVMQASPTATPTATRTATPTPTDTRPRHQHKHGFDGSHLYRDSALPAPIRSGLRPATVPT
jgi:hypothetical protein